MNPPSHGEISAGPCQRQGSQTYRIRSWTDLKSPIDWEDGKVFMLDQRLLPTQEVWNLYTDHHQVAGAIRDMVIRGAPAIGCAAAMGIAAGARQNLPGCPHIIEEFERICSTLAQARPTAVNLFWAIERQKRVMAATLDQGLPAVLDALDAEALTIWKEDIRCCRQMGRLGSSLIPAEATILTHCNAGALATGGYGTALGVIRGAIESGKKVRVFADETRPFLQGARLTAWELSQEGIDVTVICDNSAASLMSKGEVQCVVVGSDRIAQNGDVANKIGTLNVAILARHFNIPFYVAAPLSTIDLEMADGRSIPIEERPALEVTHVGETQVVPSGVAVKNSAFDVTPNELVTAIITEAGIAYPPYTQSIKDLYNHS